MLKVKVRCLLDTHLNTGSAEYNVSRGQVFTCSLKCQQVLDELVKLQVLELVDTGVKEEKKLPVFYPVPRPDAVLLGKSGELLPLSGGLEQDA